MKGRTALAGIGIFVLVFGGVLAALQVDRMFRHREPQASLLSQEPPIIKTQAVAGHPAFDFSAAAAKVIPSVVSVDNYGTGRTFFGDVAEQKMGSGSGVIISREGYVLTNCHVVADATSLRVRLADKRTMTATLVGADRRSDLALLKIPAQNLTPIALGDSKSLKPGEWVMAVGSPLGFDSTVSVGVVSSLGRVLPTEDAILFDMIQTDAAINQGNSGGALTNAAGELVGINSAIASTTGGSIGLGFSIPIARAQRVVEDLTKYGRVRYGTIGVEYDRRDIILSDPRAREELKDLTHSPSEPPAAGLLIRNVVAGTPAARAGVKQWDVVLAVDSKEVKNRVDLESIMTAKRPGDGVTVKIWSAGKTREIKLTLADPVSL